MSSTTGPEARPSTPDGQPALPVIAPALGDLAAAFDLAYYTPLQEHRSAADTKAGGILTATGLLFTILARYSPHIFAVSQSAAWPVRLVIFAMVGAFGLLAVGAVVRAFQTISPRFHAAPESLLYFGDIARLDREEYIRRVEALSREEALAHMLAYNHTLSVIVVEKFRDLNQAIRLFEGAFFCWLALAALIAWDVFR
jgi:hypothetical protein